MQKSISNRRSARNGVKKSPKNVVHKMFTLLQIRDLRIVFTKKAVSKKRGQCFCPRLCAVCSLSGRNCRRSSSPCRAARRGCRRCKRTRSLSGCFRPCYCQHPLLSLIAANMRLALLITPIQHNKHILIPIPEAIITIHNFLSANAIIIAARATSKLVEMI